MGGLGKNPLCGGGMDIFWKYTYTIWVPSTELEVQSCVNDSPILKNFPCRIPNINALEAVCRRNDLLSHLMDHPGDWTPVVMDWLLHLVTRGLGKRVELLCFKPQTPLQVK